MAISAFLEPELETGDRARATRRTLRLEATGRRESGEDTEVLVHNASATGLLLESPEPLDEGERIAIELPHAGPTVAEIVWRSDKLYGCRFDAPISAAALSAAQLRSVVGEPIGLPAPRHGKAQNGASFGLRLQNLRKARGLTLANIAEALAVSKPTVWAWEHGKARPVEGRLDGLAEALGVSRETLEPETGGFVPGELIEHCRSQIADAAGVDPVSVRIMIDL